MPGGTWTNQNKIRPGAYINFHSVPKPTSSVGERGIMTVPAPLSWGPQNEVIPLYSTDLLDGASLPKIGLTAFDAASLVFREALSYAYLCLVYRIDIGGEKAQGEIDPLTITAKYAGELGNELSVMITDSARGVGYVDVITALSGSVKDRQTVMVAEELISNDWVTFSGEGALLPSTGLTLEGGTNGEVTDDGYTGYFNAVGQRQWNTMALPDASAALKMQALAYIKEQRDGQGRKRQVVYQDDTAADYEGVIVTRQGYINTAGERITPELFPVTAASLTAAAKVNQSNTYHIIANAASILGELTDKEIGDALVGGYFVLSRRQDGVIVVEQDINSFVSFMPDKARDFSKNRVIRCLDDINNVIVLKFERSYIGKVDNNAVGRSIFRADITSYLTELQDMGAIQNFDPSTDISVEQGMDIEAVLAKLWIQPVDAMEKLYMDVYCE